jgi:hypothetical protein
MSPMDMAVAELRDNPFNAYSVAGGRLLTYMKSIVMKYIEIVIAAGDECLRENMLESIPLAIQYYIGAIHLYGPSLRQVMPWASAK